MHIATKIPWKEEYPEPSEAFEHAVAQGGTNRATCELCGRENFVSNYHDREEIEQLRKKANEQPERYFEHRGCDSVITGWISGFQVVIGCPCNRLRLIENVIWENRHTIASYLKKRSREEEKIANAAARQFSSL